MTCLIVSDKSTRKGDLSGVVGMNPHQIVIEKLGHLLVV